MDGHIRNIVMTVIFGVGSRMAGGILKDRCVLVVEDEYFLADEMVEILLTAGASILGPASTLEKTLLLLQSNPAPHLAVLDVNLGGIPVYPVADLLMKSNVPFVFATGLDRSRTPRRYAHVRVFEKPLDTDAMLDELERLLQSASIFSARAISA